QEKEKQKKAREVAKNLESYLSNNDKKLDDKFKELMKNKDIRRYILAGGAAAALVLLGPWVGGKVHEAVSHYFSGPTAMAENIPTGMAKESIKTVKEEHLTGVTKGAHEQVKHLKHLAKHPKLPAGLRGPYPVVHEQPIGMGRETPSTLTGPIKAQLEVRPGAPTEVHAGEAPAGVRVEPTLRTVPPESYRVPTPEVHHEPPTAPPSPGQPPGAPGHPAEPITPGHVEQRPAVSGHEPGRPPNLSDPEYKKYLEVQNARAAAARRAAAELKKKGGVPENWPGNQ
ncbi:MAG: hypothetical protein NTX00_03640, partial [Candidatus Parcubacteria bacterium]|nr:hypothetical protein [Candidatus Parcubacteria bacterium]